MGILPESDRPRIFKKYKCRQIFRCCCVPVGACGEIAKEISAAFKAGSIVTDVGSVKAAVVRDVGGHIPQGVYFIPGHPIAGTEQSGPASGFADLFVKRWCVLTPLPDSNASAVTRLKNFWHACGSEVDLMTPEHHDLVLAITSHLPHLIAYNTVATAADLEEVTDSEVIKYSAGGFRDFTRIAASDPTMWRDVFLNNREAVLEMLGRFSEDLSALQRAIRWGDGETLFNLFTRAREVRRNIIAAGQETATIAASPAATGIRVRRNGRCDTWSDISSEAGRAGLR